MNDKTNPAADLAQRIAELEAERDRLMHEHHTVRADAQARVNAAVIRALAAERERDGLRARLAELGQQEPVAWLAPAKVSEDWPWPYISVTPDAHPHIIELLESFPVYAGPVHAIQEDWKLVPVEPTPEMLDAARSQSSFPLGVYRAMIAAAPEHKA